MASVILLGIWEPMYYYNITQWFPNGSECKESTCNIGVLEMEAQVPSLGWEDPLEEEMATHSSILAWRISQKEEPRGLQLIGSHKVGYI